MGHVNSQDLNDSRQAKQAAQPQGDRSGRRPEGWWEYLGVVGVGKIAVLAALICWMYWGHLCRLYSYWQQPDWSHGFLIPVFSLYLVHMKREALLRDSHQGSIVGFVVVVLSVYGYIESVRINFSYPQPLTIVTLIAGLVLLLRGWRSLWLVSFPIAFLFLAIPPPVRLYRALTHPLQQGAAAVSTWILNTFPGAEVERSGINIAFFMDNGDTGTFTIAGACSGMRSLMAFVALGLAMAYFAPRPYWQRITMAIVVVPVAFVCNILRVLVTGSFQMYGHPELATGTPHTLLGFLVFALGFAMYMGILWCLDHLIVEESNEPAASSSKSEGGGS